MTITRRPTMSLPRSITRAPMFFPLAISPITKEVSETKITKRREEGVRDGTRDHRLIGTEITSGAHLRDNPRRTLFRLPFLALCIVLVAA